MKKPRKTLAQIQYYPTPKELYEQLMASAGWEYKTQKEFYLCRDRALVGLLYLGDFRAVEVLPINKSNFKQESKYLLAYGIKVGKRKQGSILYREAKLPLTGPRSCFTELIQKYLDLLEPEDRLFPWSLKEKVYQVGYYLLKDGTRKPRMTKTLVGTVRMWQITHALLPHLTQHWLRAFGYNWDYDHMDHDILAVSDKTKADPRSIQPYLRKRYEKYPVT